LQEKAREVYEERLKFGVAREQARKDLPLSTYTEAYWKCDLHNLLHFLRLRLDPHAQLEVREYATMIAEIVKEWVPTVWEAFEDYVLYSQKFSRMEMEGMKVFISMLVDESHGAKNLAYRQQTTDEIIAVVLGSTKMSGREKVDFEKKLKFLVTK
jgi:thymidylate synthase (FAD)